MSSIVEKKIRNTIYVYEVEYIRTKRKYKWKCLGKRDSDGVLISNKKKLPSEIVEVKRVSKEFILKKK